MIRSTRRRRLNSHRLIVENLEGRQLLSVAGAPDTSFGGTGSVVVPVSENFAGTGPNAVYQDAITTQVDGKVVVAGIVDNDDVIVRLNADGSRDTSFGQDGQVLFSGESSIASVVVQADGKIIVAGTEPVAFNSESNDFVAERFNADGSVDSTYGTSGIATFSPPGANPPTQAQPDGAYLKQAVLDSNGDLVLGGTAYLYTATANTGPFLVARLTPSGVLDTTFGQSGIAIVPGTINGDTGDILGGIAIQPDGEIVGGGMGLNGQVEGNSEAGAPVSEAQPIAFRLNSDGSLDTTFGPTSPTPGVVSLDFPGAAGIANAVVADDGRIILEENGLTLYGLNSAGALDPTFGTGGVAKFGNETSLDTLAVDPQGRLVAGGSIDLSSAGSDTTTQDTAIVRFNADGSIDASFGDENPSQIDGLSTPSFGGTTYDPEPRSVTIGADGSIFLANRVDAVLGGDLVPTFAVAKVEPDGLPIVLEPSATTSTGTPAGSPDTSFGGTGSAVVPVSTDFTGAGPNSVTQSATAVQADGKVLVAGTLTNGTTTDAVLVRLNADGTRDASFGQDGQVLAATSLQTVASVLVQADGKILVVGLDPPNIDVDLGIPDNIAVERFNSDGSVDTSYGNQGVAIISAVDSSSLTYDPGGSGAVAQAALDANGNLVIAGDGNSILPGSTVATFNFIVDRLTPSGMLDPTFGSGGVVVIPGTIDGVTDDTAGGLAIQTGGKIVVAGTAQADQAGDTQPIVFRLNANGTLDTTFGPNSPTPGEVTFAPDPAAPTLVGSITVSAVTIDGGRIILAGNNIPTPSPSPAFGAAFLYGINAAGSLDPGFGTGGVVSYPSDPNALVAIDSLGVDPSGRIVAFGSEVLYPSSANAGNNVVKYATVARYNADGTADTTLGSYNSQSIAGLSTPFDGIGTILATNGAKAGSAAVGPDGSIYLSGQLTADLGGNLVPTFAVAKLPATPTPTPGSPAGTGDPGFGVVGSTFQPVASNFQSTGPTSVKESAVATQPDGKILLAGTIVEDGSTYLALVRTEPDGSRDTSFGNGGQALFADAVSVSSVLVQSDGKTLVVGSTLEFANGGFAETPEVIAVRFNADGSLDTTYSNHGVAQFGIMMSDGTMSSQVHVAGAALDAGGNLVIAGDALIRSDMAVGASIDDLIVARITPAGALDTGFNTTGIAMIPVAVNDMIEDSAAGIAIQPDGKIVVGGNGVYGFNYILGTNGSQVIGLDDLTQPIAVRLNPDGSLDTTFGTTGTVVLSNQADVTLPLGSVTINALTLDGDQIVLGGLKSRLGGDLSVLYRLNADGSLDTTFGNSGEATGEDNSGITALEVMPAGQIVAETGDHSVYRFTVYGSPDPTFGNTTTPGLESITYGPGSSLPQLDALSFALNGDILVAGTTQYVLGGDLVTVFAATELDPNPTPAPNTSAGVSAGTLDTGFGQTNGYATVNFPLDSAANATAETVQPNGDILLAGKELARLLPSGALDTSFGIGGTIPLANGTAEATDVFALPNGEIEVFGYINALPVLLRYTATGQADTTFGTGGEYTYPSSKDPLFPASAKATMLADGSLIVAGDISDSIVASHLNLDGSVDTSYGSGGATIVGVRVAAMTPPQTVAGLVVEPDGDVVIAGNVVTGTTPTDMNETDVFAIELLPTGKADTSFGGSANQGQVVINPETTDPTVKDFFSVTGVALESDGNIVLGGSTYGSTVVTVLNPDGSLHTAFGDLGVATVPTDQSPGGTQAGGGVIVEPNSQVVVVSTVAGAGGTTAMLAARFNTDGTLDTSFGNPDTPGVATYLAGGSSAEANAVVVQPDGNVLIAGTADIPASGTAPATQVFAVARVKYQPTDANPLG